MNVYGSRDFAHRAAANITDPLSRAGLAEKHREAAAVVDGTLTGLTESATTRDLRVAPNLAADLRLARKLLAEAAETLQTGDVHAPRLTAVAA